MIPDELNDRSRALLELLPAIYRIRDAETASQLGLDRGPLQDLLTVVARELAIVEENMEQAYDDLFVETSASWVLPYIGDLIGYRTLHGNVPEIAAPRAEVGHTIALRRRKGTAVVLEQLAHDVTRWPVRAVEYFQRLGWTQNVNHIRPREHYAPDMRAIDALTRSGTPFANTSHTVDMRRVGDGGRFNIPNIGIHLWRVAAYRHTRMSARQLDARRYFISPLGQPMNLYSKPQPRTGNLTTLAQPENIPLPLTRFRLKEDLSLYYGLRATEGDDPDLKDPSIVVWVDGKEIPRDRIVVCNLATTNGAWARAVEGDKVAIDPELGRIALPASLADKPVATTYHRGFTADMGGGEYDRQPMEYEGLNVVRVPDDHSTVQAALDAVSNGGVVEITDNGVYQEELTMNASVDATVVLRAERGRQPHIVLPAANDKQLKVSGQENARVHFEGLVISGNAILVEAGNPSMAELAFRDCTLVPGISLDEKGDAEQPDKPSIRVLQDDVSVALLRSITGPIQIPRGCSVDVQESIVDALDKQRPALAGTAVDEVGATVNIVSSTIIGRVLARAVKLLSNSIVIAEEDDGAQLKPAIYAQRKQSGCVRFSFLPDVVIVPRRFHTLNPAADGIAPQFSSMRFGDAGYCQLARSTVDAIWSGADDEGEMGAFHHLYQSQRERNLRIRLDEYVRVGMEAGIFYES